MGATLNPFASPEARKSIEELQVWTGLKEDFLDIGPNAGSWTFECLTAACQKDIVLVPEKHFTADSSLRPILKNRASPCSFRLGFL